MHRNSFRYESNSGYLSLACWHRLTLVILYEKNLTTSTFHSVRTQAYSIGQSTLTTGSAQKSQVNGGR